jgi:WD40 repeat protein
MGHGRETAKCWGGNSSGQVSDKPLSWTLPWGYSGGMSGRAYASMGVTLALGMVLQSAASIAQSHDHILEFTKKIGVGWRPDKYGWMSFVSFSPNGTMVASDGPAAPYDVSGNLTLWSFPEGRLIKRISAKPTAISRDWKYYATSGGVTEMETGKPLISLGKGRSANFTFSPDSRYVAESGNSRQYAIRVLELPTGKQVSAFGNGKHDAFGIAMSPDGGTLASGSWDLVTLWNPSTGERRAVLRGFKRYVVGLSFSPDGRLLAGGTDAGGLQIWDVARLARIASLDIEGGGVSEPVFSPDGHLVAVGVYGTGTAWLIDVSSGKIIDHQKVSDLGCGSVGFSPDGSFLITPSTGGLITWPYDRGGTIRVFRVILR